MEFAFLPFLKEREKMGSIIPRSVNDPITTLLFLEEFKNTMMAPLLYIFISFVIQQSQSFFVFFFSNKKK